MGFMQPIAEHMSAFHVETNAGTEIVPAELVDVARVQEGELELLRDYCEGRTIESAELKEGWYARLSAAGYMDCTSWDGPHETAEEALQSVKDMYDVDDEGDDASCS